MADSLFTQIPGLGNLPGLGGNITDLQGALLGKGWIGGAILFITSSELVDAIQAWLKTITFFFGNHEGTMNAVSDIMSLPYLTPVSSLIKPELFPANIKPDDTFQGLLTKLPDSAMKAVQDAAADSPLLNSFIKPGNAIGSLLGFNPPAVTNDINGQVNKKSSSLLNILQNEITPAEIGNKFINDNALVKDVKEFAGDLTGKWLKIKSFEELGSVVGEAVTDVKNIMTSVTNLVQGLSSTVIALMEEVRKVDEGLLGLKEDAFRYAQDTIDQVERVIPSLEFTLLLIPPRAGTAKELRVVVEQMFQSGTVGRPEVDDNALVFPVVIVFQGGLEIIVSTQYNLLTSLLNQVV